MNEAKLMQVELTENLVALVVKEVVVLTQTQAHYHVQ